VWPAARTLRSTAAFNNKNDTISTPTLPPHLHTAAQLEIARHIRHPDGSRRYGDLNSFLQVNRTVYLLLNHKLWKEAAEDAALATRVFVHVNTNNNIAGLQRLLESGADPELRLPGLRLIDLDNGVFDYQQFQQTPLVLAACVVNLAMATVLLAKGADVEYRIASTSSYSPLHAARSATMVDLLLDHNADPQWLDEGGYPPIIWYIRRRDSACLRAILQRGAEVNGDWLVPLCAAAELDLGIVQLLLNYGADLNARTPSGDTALHYAATAGNLDICSGRFALAAEPPLGQPIRQSARI
jgi:ankyrin repeat protein